MASPTSSDHVHIPHCIDDIAARTPSRPWVIVPQTPDVKREWRTITFGELAKAVDGASRWIESTIGIPEHERETIAYLGLHDARYMVFMFALIKTNYRALFLSLRNSDAAQIHVMQRTDCSCYFYTEGIDSSLDVFAGRQQELRGFQIPGLDDLITLGEQGHFHSRGATGPEEKVVTMHSSGSTGMPKPIFVNNVWFTGVLRQKYLVPPPNRSNRAEGWLGPSVDGKPLITAAPMYHGMALLLYLRSIFTGPLVLLPPGVPLNSGIIMEALEMRLATCGMFPPSIIQELSATDRGLRAISTLDDIYYGGAPLSRSVGERVRSVTRISSIIGSVETSCIPALAPENLLDWDYFDFHPDSGATLEDAGDGLAELVLKPLAGCLWLQPVFSIFPGITEWRTSDLFEQHPQRVGLWRFRHRQDDLIVFNNGEKYDPIMFEKTVENHPLVKGALVVGRGKFQPGLIIEPDWTLVQGDDARSLLQQLWPVVEEANSSDATQARIRKDMIVLASREKPFCRTAKHSIAKRATLELYAPDIEALYSPDRVDEELSAQLGVVSKNPGHAELRGLVRRALEALLDGLPDGHSDEDDIFNLAVDSMLVLSLARALGHALQESSVAVGSADVYANPTINKLAAVIQGKLNGASEAYQTPRERVMEQLVERYTADLPHVTDTSPPPPDHHTVILTGSTGSLGSYILETLLESPNVAKVYCLNRSEQAADRQKTAFASRGIRSNLDRATFLHTDFSLPHFGLPQSTYSSLSATATLFIHAAWAVNFNHALPSFAPTHLAGIHHIAAFSLHSTHRCHIAFISSIAAVANHPSPVPEAPITAPAAAAHNGYAESKHVGERILGAAAAAGAPVAILRCGQLAGPRAGGGGWARQEWLPSLVVSAGGMGTVPARLGAEGDGVAWLPVDAAARAVVECAVGAVGRGGRGVEVFHVVNPRATAWSGLVPVVREFYREARGREVEVVGFDEWVAALKAVALTAEEVRLKPSVKMVDFYESMKAPFPALSTARAVACSKSLRESGPVDAALFGKWLKQWA